MKHSGHKSEQDLFYKEKLNSHTLACNLFRKIGTNRDPYNFSKNDSVFSIFEHEGIDLGLVCDPVDSVDLLNDVLGLYGVMHQGSAEVMSSPSRQNFKSDISNKKQL